MNRHIPSTKTIILAIAGLHYCYFSTAYAEETEQTVTSAAKTTPQPPVVDQQAAPSYGPKETLETTISTPQPPKIDETPEPSYGPPPESSSEPPEQKDSSSTTSDSNSKTDVTESVNKTAETEVDNKHNTTWHDTRPGNVDADWLQLTSGEWLRGRIIAMQKETLEFDSDELKLLEIEWKKVKYIKSSEPYSLRLDDRTQATGAIEITLNEIHVKTDYDDQTFNRSELLSIASGHETEISKWTNKVTFSINVRRGNTDQTDFTSKITAKRRTVNSRLLLDYLGNFTEVENTETINNHRINTTYDVFITRNLFVTPVTMEFFRDPFQNIDKRKNIGVAIGYTIINTSESEWDVSGGPAYQETEFVSVQVGQSSKDVTATLILSTKFDTELNSKVDLEGTYSVTLGDTKTGGYTHHSLLTIETELTEKLDFDVTGVWDRVKSPVQAANNDFPEQDDFRILIGLGYDL